MYWFLRGAQRTESIGGKEITNGDDTFSALINPLTTCFNVFFFNIISTFFLDTYLTTITLYEVGIAVTLTKIGVNGEKYYKKRNKQKHWTYP